MIGAFAYLIFHSVRNRLLSRVRRLRSPRYAVTLLLALAYFYFMFFRGSLRGGGRNAPPIMGMTVTSILPVILLLMSAYAWIFGADRAALAFSEAEVAMLFTAPVSRRGLVVYKLIRSQAAVLTTSIIWAVVFGRGGRTFEGFVSYWALLSLITLHRLGIALLRASTAEHGARGFKKTWLAITVFGAAFFSIAWTLYATRARWIGLEDITDYPQALMAVTATPPMSWVLYPFHVAVGPIAASHGAPWFKAMGPALVLIAVHVWWVLRTQSAFEEAAAEASAAQARRLEAFRNRGLKAVNIKTTGRQRTIGLRSRGNPAIAILWKNFLWLQRTGQIRSLVGLPLILCVVAFVAAGRWPTVEFLVVIVSFYFAAMALVFGPTIMRNDLRGELLRLPMLKTMPLSGRQIMLAEVASSALPIAFVQIGTVIAGLMALPYTGHPSISPEKRLAILAGAPLVLLGLTFANFTIHNGLALLFPAWVRLGEAGAAGIEVMGQTMLTMIVTLVMLAIMMLTPGLVAGGIYFVMRSAITPALTTACAAAGIILLVEAYLLIGVLGGSLQRLEPMQVG